MDKKTFLALVLTALVIVVTPLLFPRKPAPPPTPTRVADSPSVRGDTSFAAPLAAPAVSQPIPAAPSLPAAAPADTTTVLVDGVAYAIAQRGASPLSVTLDSAQYRSLSPDPRRRGRPVRIEAPTGALLGYRLALGADTIALDTVAFSVERTASAVTFVSAGAPQIRIAYRFDSSSYLAHVQGEVAGAPPGSMLLISMPTGLRSDEADTTDDQGHLNYGYKPRLGDVESIGFGSLDPGEVETVGGPLQWVSLRNKYFLVVAMAPDSASEFLGVQARGGVRTGKMATLASGTVAQPLRDGTFRLDLYTGPQEWERLRSFQNDLENVHPYAGWGHKLVQPFATIVMRILLWMKATLQLNYGWVLILFGVAVRIALWPLNQGAMRTSIRMQRLQPELQALQKRYADDRERQRTEMIRLYQEHGMSPFSPLLGCLPMLLPMPVLFALYFVFQNTIEIRGVSFLWLPDLALKDPTFATPIFMGLTMLLLSWIGMRGVPPTPQTKMMAYMMPAVMTFMFLQFPSGLNLYYAVQNVAAMPQQWLVARERAKAAPVAARSTPAPPPPRARKRDVG